MSTLAVPTLHTRVDPADHRIQELLELMKYEYIGLYGFPDPDPYADLSGAKGGRGAVSLIEVAGKAVAMAGVTFPFQFDVAVMHRVFTRWEFRHQGHARTLVLQAEADARQLKARALHLETGTAQTHAIHLYSSLGYSAVEPFGFYAGQSTSVFLGKDL